jgi:hypothetical protein
MYPYRAFPWHQLFPVIILLLSAAITGAFPSGPMIIAFIIIAIICLVTGLWIAIAGSLEKYTDYWESVGRDIDKLQKAPTESWGALGFVTPPTSVTVRQNMTGEPGESSYYAEKTFTIDLSPEKLQIIANALLTGTKSLAESEWKDTAIGTTKIREVKQQLLRAGLAKYRNPRNRLDGMDLTERGVTYLYQYASDYVRADPDLQVIASKLLNRPPSEETDPVQL